MIDFLDKLEEALSKQVGYFDQLAMPSAVVRAGKLIRTNVEWKRRGYGSDAIFSFTRSHLTELARWGRAGPSFSTLSWVEQNIKMIEPCAIWQKVIGAESEKEFLTSLLPISCGGSMDDLNKALVDLFSVPRDVLVRRDEACGKNTGVNGQLVPLEEGHQGFGDLKEIVPPKLRIVGSITQKMNEADIERSSDFITGREGR